jgi:multidrug efflux pump subunit AcrB
MWIVRLALRRPYTFVVMSILIVIMGGLAIVRTPTDIFPNINIPVVSIIWNYNGLLPQDMSDRIVSVTERALTTTVDNIEHIESQSLYGTAVVKVFLQPNANIQQGIAQITAISQTQLRQLPAERRRRSFWPTAHRVCPYSNWRFRGKICRSNNSTTMA